MKLVNISFDSIVDPILANSEWKITSQPKGKNGKVTKGFYLSNQQISQRIGINKVMKLDHINNTLHQVLNKPTDPMFIESYSYSLPDLGTIVRNPNNMNLILNKGSKPDNDIYIYLSLATNKCILFDYQTDDAVKVIHTYRKRGEYQGCVLRVNNGVLKFNGELNNETSENNTKLGIISLDMKVDGKYYNATVSIDVKPSDAVGDKTTKVGKSIGVDVEVSPISNKVICQQFDRLNYDTKMYKGFKLHDIEGLCTTAFIVREDLSEELTETLSKDENINGTNIYVIPVSQDMLTKADGSYSKALTDLVTDGICNKGCRAITLVGVKVPNDFCIKFKILYLFNYNMKTNITHCIKSV